MSKKTVPMSKEIEHTEVIEWPHAQLRTERTIESGTIARFMTQLEYRVDDNWEPVVRFDHDIANETAHNIEEEGLHMDVYRDGEIARKATDFPTLSLDRYPRFCEAYATKHADKLLRRYEQWHDIHPK